MLKQIYFKLLSTKLHGYWLPLKTMIKLMVTTRKPYLECLSILSGNVQQKLDIISEDGFNFEMTSQPPFKIIFGAYHYVWINPILEYHQYPRNRTRFQIDLLPRIQVTPCISRSVVVLSENMRRTKWSRELFANILWHTPLTCWS